ncbi:MAG: transglycosylase SLT domain-containing protein [Saprospiraceae bacterium]|nr:transglycosylase SLT domain-containing protein [Saprospiraceae bacterium]MCF8251429.1 transglycosylase SLT domain-containing protein [Saprospiraceae bacterium]MCF8282557.1 transglycosylase SLT domain-containing protein [Bacteroidales bacterium]MCF8313024.1 transglycosylase SLT domain-containing protein [Saprospiraceae bacterium]MCF8441471.1 transglycosylase SLT domain-containing protein [Saprospiraceae bacterium]
MKNSVKYYIAALAAFASVAIFTAYTPESKAGIYGGSESLLSIPHVQANDEFWFAGERIPVKNFDVRERLERELIVNSYRHSTTILNLKNSARYFPVMEKILKENGLPDDFKYLAVAESDLRNASSPAGAKGLWQFMEGTAEEYGMEVNKEVDERLHLEKSTRAACAYLKKYKERFGSWALVAAAYNMGPTGLRNEIEAQKSDNYYDLNLNDETNRYIFRLVAIKHVMEHPELYGFDMEGEQLYPPLDNYALVTVDSSIANLGDFAKQFGVSYRMLKVFNPWLKDNKLTNSKRKAYDIKIPK